MHYFWPGLTWIRTLNPPDKVKKKKKLGLSGFELGTFGSTSQNYPTEPRGLRQRNGKIVKLKITY